MSRQIPIDHPSLDLTSSLNFVLSTLEEGAVKRKHDLHLLVLGTVDKDNNPQTRNVVLRKVDLSLNHLFVFTQIKDLVKF